MVSVERCRFYPYQRREVVAEPCMRLCGCPAGDALPLPCQLVPYPRFTSTAVALVPSARLVLTTVAIACQHRYRLPASPVSPWIPSRVAHAWCPHCLVIA